MDNYKKLTRSREDRKIAGVCAGVAHYLNIDPTAVRVIFLLALIMGSFGFWAYLIMWIAVPEEDWKQLP